MEPARLKLFKKLYEPVAKKDSLQIIVKRFFTDVNGTIIDKTDPAVPAAMQVNYPVYLFNEYDRKGGLFWANNVLPPKGDAKLLCSFIWGNTNPMFFGLFSGANDIQNEIHLGDVVTVYTDSLVIPSVFVWIVQSANRNSLGAIYSNLDSHTHFTLPMLGAPVDSVHMETTALKYYTDVVDQWKQVFSFNKISPSGAVQIKNNLSAWNFKKPTTINDQFINIPAFDLSLDQYIGIFFNMLFDTDSIEFEFILKKQNVKF